MLLDLRAAVRSIARSPWYFAGAVLTLGLALGVVTTAFGLLAGAVSDTGSSPEGRAILYQTEVVNGRESRARWPYAAVGLLREQARTFAAIATYTTGAVNLGAGADGARLDVEFVSPEYFDVTDAAPVAGRTFARAAQESAGEPAEVVIGFALWQRSFAGSPTAIGQTLRISRIPLTIVGVMPEGFRGLSGRAAIWVPHTMAPTVSFAGYLTSEEYFHNVVATLAPGASLADANSELALVGRRIAERVPARSDNASDRAALAVPLSDARTSPAAVRARFLIAVGAVLVLLVAAVNLANLMAARVAARQREFSVRLAVGASRLHVWRSIGGEVLLILVAGLATAVILATWTRDAVAMLIPQGIANPGNDYGQLASYATLEIDAPVLVAVTALAVLTLLLACVVSSRSIFRADLVTTLRRGGDRSSTAGPGRGGRVLIAAQAAASLCLAASAGLILRSVAALDDVHPGFDASRVIAFSVAEDLADRPEAGPLLAERLLDGLARTPGVAAITVGQCTPFGSRCARLGFSVEGRPDTASRPLVTGWHRVGPDHFRALGIPVTRGRGFSIDDRRGRPPVVVVNEAAARRFFAGEDPIGRRIRLPAAIAGDPEVAEIVGVVGDVIYWPPDEAPGPDIYQPALQFSYAWTTVMVRIAPGMWRDPILWSRPAAQPVIARLRDRLAAIDPDLPMFDVVTMNDLARAGRADRRFVSVLITACAALALLLAAVGVYSVTAGWLESRRKELGVRVALGADPAGLVRLAMSGALRQTAAGAIAGVGLALGAGRILQALLPGVGPGDLIALAGAVIVMLAVAAIAAWLPARRALRIDPLRELNAE